MTNNPEGEMNELDIDVVSLCHSARLAELTTGELLPITHYMGLWGDFVDGPDDAVTAIAGREGLWLCIRLDQFKKASVH